MTLSEQLAALEQELKRLLTADNAEMAEAISQTKLPEWAAEVEPVAYIAGTLLSVEWACKLLRDRLGVPLEVAAHVEFTPLQIIGPLEDGTDTPEPEN
jgi:hypothetical protein